MTLLPTGRFGALVLFAFAAAGCNTVEGSLAIETPAYDTSYSGPKLALAVGRFSNSSSYLRGNFTGGPDRLGNQGRAILETHLARTNRFALDEPGAAVTDAGIADTKTTHMMITGQMTALGPGAAESAIGEVRLNVVDTRTSRVLYSVRGEGAHELSEDEAARFRGTSAYDGMVVGQVLDRALGVAVGELVSGLERGEWGLESD